MMLPHGSAGGRLCGAAGIPRAGGVCERKFMNYPARASQSFHVVPNENLR